MNSSKGVRPMDSFIKCIENISSYIVKSFNKVVEKGKDLYNSDRFSMIRAIHFEPHHFRTILIASLCVFFITLHFTGLNTTRVEAFDVKDVIHAYNEEVIRAPYAHTDTFGDIAKDILSSKVSVLTEPVVLKNTASHCIYEIGGYVADVKLLGEKKLGEAEAEIRITTKDTYYAGNDKIVEFYCEDKEAEIKEGMVCIYRVNLDVVDEDAPRIVLSEDDVTLSEEDSFNPSSYLSSITDNFDGNIFEYTVENNDLGVNGDLYIGKHVLTYRVKDSSGNEATANLIVRVKEKVKPVVNQYRPVADSPYAGSIVAEARRLLGAQYVWGGTGPYAFDCSGLVQYVYGRAGIYVPRTSGQQAHYGQAINPNDMSSWRAGDIITFGPGGNEHVAIYSGYGTLIHALNPNEGVRETGVFGAIYSVRRP